MWQRARGELARMVIKNDQVRLGLWKLRFQDGHSLKECVDRLTDAKVAYYMVVIGHSLSMQYRSNRTHSLSCNEVGAGEHACRCLMERKTTHCFSDSTPHSF